MPDPIKPLDYAPPLPAQEKEWWQFAWWVYLVAAGVCGCCAIAFSIAFRKTLDGWPALMIAGVCVTGGLFALLNAVFAFFESR